MRALKERLVTSPKGKPIGVLLSLQEYRKILEELEELEAIRAYDAAKDSDDKAIPFEQAVKAIKRSRK